MFHIDPFVEEMLHSLNERIRNGNNYMKEHPQSKKNEQTLLIMKKKRRFLNYIYAYQLSMETRLSDPKQIVADISAMKKLYISQNPEDRAAFDQQESRLCNDLASALENEVSNPASELLDAYNVFDIGYDYENLDQFLLDAENLLKKTVLFTLAILDVISPIPSVTARNK